MKQDTILDAARWMARLWSGEASDDERQACAAWLAADPEHKRAWNYLQRLEGKLTELPAHAAHGHLLAPPGGLSRRRVLTFGGLLLGSAALFQQAHQHRLWQRSLADLRTATGEIRQQRLADGSLLYLNTGTHLDLRFDTHQRRLVLFDGEILVETAIQPTPLRVETRHGLLTAFGTRFSVRDDQPGDIRVAVYQGALRIEPHAAPAMVLTAGNGTRFSSQGGGPTLPANEHDTAWRHGKLVAEAMPLPQLVAELARYRPGLLDCDASLAERLVSGVFPLDDTDRALANLQQTLPIRLRYRSRYWVSVQPL